MKEILMKSKLNTFENLVKLLNKDVKFDQVKPAFSKSMGSSLKHPFSQPAQPKIKSNIKKNKA